MKAAVFDIETSGLEAVGAGTLLCAVIKPLDGSMVVFRADELRCRPGKEHKLVQAVVGELSNYDLLIGHNIIRFDFPWLRSRTEFFHLPEPKRAFMYDTLSAFKRLGYKTVPNHFGKPSASLGHVTDFYGFEQEKTSLFPRDHWRTVWESGENRRVAMDKLVHHCKSDVRMNEKIYWVLMRADANAVIKRAR